MSKSSIEATLSSSRALLIRSYELLKSTDRVVGRPLDFSVPYRKGELDPASNPSNPTSTEK